MASFSHTIPVSTPYAELWSLVCDVSRIAGLASYTRVEDLSTPEPNCWLFWRQLAIPNIAELRWRERARVIREGEMHFQAVEGDLGTFAGYWRVAPAGVNSSLTLEVEYVIPEGMNQKMPAFVVNYVMDEIFKSICQHVKEAAEGDNA